MEFNINLMSREEKIEAIADFWKGYGYTFEEIQAMDDYDLDCEIEFINLTIIGNEYSYDYDEDIA